ncbi:MAG TPA: DUF1839 family protein [Polyangiaceae bacterium]
MTHASALGLDPVAYAPHALHGEGCAWVEKNCYVDPWIEVLHALHLDPMALMPFTVAVDFEGDQWTFFKPPHHDLAVLYGVDVQELNVWRPLVRHVEEHVGQGKLVLTEADAWFLPDAKGTDYGRQHTKTTIVIETIDTEACTLGYFHNAGYHALEGADFAGVLRTDPSPDPAVLPLFAELAHLDRLRRLPSATLAERSVQLLRGHLARRPSSNPVERFKRRFVADLEEIGPEGLAQYHVYAFATLRQCGASFELASLYLTWLDDARGDRELTGAAKAFDDISTTAKALILKGARAVTTRKAADFAPMLDRMQESWQAAMELLESRFGAARAAAE